MPMPKKSDPARVSCVAALPPNQKTEQEQGFENKKNRPFIGNNIDINDCKKNEKANPDQKGQNLHDDILIVVIGGGCAGYQHDTENGADNG